MGLPKITFNIAKNGLGLVGDGVQKVPGLLLSGASVADKVTIGSSYQIFSLAAAIDLGITEESNPFAYKHIKDFYNEAGEGAELWFMIVSDATTYDQMADVNENLAKKLIADASGKIRVLGLLKKSNGVVVAEEGLDPDVKAGVIKAQTLALYYAEKYMPYRVLLSGNNFSGIAADLFDYETAEYDRVNMLLASSDGAAEASIGVELGRIARIPTQRSIARVKDGSVLPLKAFFTNGGTVESLVDFWDLIHDKGYTFFRSFPGRSGYFFTDDKTLSSSQNDFNSLARGLMMDEAILIANDTLTEELSDEVPVTDEGTIHPAIIKSYQGNIENQINALMVQVGKLQGVQVIIDENQSILTNNKFLVKLLLQPVGYAKQIEVNIGFTTNIQ